MSQTVSGIQCCDEYHCRRSQPIRIRYGGLSKHWYAITRWKMSRPNWINPEAPSFLEAIDKHDITSELVAALLDAGWTPPCAS